MNTRRASGAQPRARAEKEHPMNVFSAFKGYEKSFCAWAAKEWQRLYGEVPAVTDFVDTAAKYLIPAAQTLVDLTCGTAAGEIVAVVGADIVKGITAVSGLVHDIGPSPHVAQSVSVLQNDLGGILAAGHITDVKSVALATRIVGELGALSNVLSQESPSKAPLATAA